MYPSLSLQAIESDVLFGASLLTQGSEVLLCWDYDVTGCDAGTEHTLDKFETSTLNYSAAFLNIELKRCTVGCW